MNEFFKSVFVSDCESSSCVATMNVIDDQSYHLKISHDIKYILDNIDERKA